MPTDPKPATEPKAPKLGSKPAPKPVNYCERCFRTEATIDQCPGQSPNSVMPCGSLVSEDPKKDIAITCGPCGFSRIVPIADLLSGKAREQLPRCTRDNCAVSKL